MQFPNVSVIGFLMLYSEGGVFAESDCGQSFKTKTKQTNKSEMRGDKELAAIQLWICVGRPKMCSISYHKEQNNKAWPLPLAYTGRRVPLLALVLLQPLLLSLTPLCEAQVRREAEIPKHPVH